MTQPVNSSQQEPQNKITWDPSTEQKFNELIAKVPVFMRGIAKDKVSQRIEKILLQENRLVVGEKDMVDAFFAETPFGFHGPMKSDMESLGIEYTKYGHPK